MTPAVTVAVEDANGNIETGDNSTMVTLAIGTNPGSGTLSGTTTVQVAAGVATFSGLSINNAGIGYTLVAAASLVTAATSTPFDIMAAQITVSQSSGLPLDYLGGPLCTGGNTPGITLNGHEQMACGRVDPVTVTNATGLSAGWTLTGQVSDFTDQPSAALSCDTVVTYNNHCIPGGDMGWIPQASVDTFPSGTSAQVEPGSPINPSTIFAPGSIVSPPPGLNATPQVLCQAPASLSQGQIHLRSRHRASCARLRRHAERTGFQGDPHLDAVLGSLCVPAVIRKEGVRMRLSSLGIPSTTDGLWRAGRPGLQPDKRRGLVPRLAIFAVVVVGGLTRKRRNFRRRRFPRVASSTAAPNNQFQFYCRAVCRCGDPTAIRLLLPASARPPDSRPIGRGECEHDHSVLCGLWQRYRVQHAADRWLWLRATFPDAQHPRRPVADRGHHPLDRTSGQGGH